MNAKPGMFEIKQMTNFCRNAYCNIKNNIGLISKCAKLHKLLIEKYVQIVDLETLLHCTDLYHSFVTAIQLFGVISFKTAAMLTDLCFIPENRNGSLLHRKKKLFIE